MNGLNQFGPFGRAVETRYDLCRAAVKGPWRQQRSQKRHGGKVGVGVAADMKTLVAGGLHHFDGRADCTGVRKLRGGVGYMQTDASVSGGG